jgi:hypothetical protein
MAGQGIAMYPRWKYYPSNTKAANWVGRFVAVVSDAREVIGTEYSTRLGGSKSDEVLAALRPGLESMGYVVEKSKAASDKIVRPVLFDEGGVARVKYEVDAFNESDGVVVEVEAGRGAQNNADYRDIVRASLILDARHLVLIMPIAYRFKNKDDVATTPAYDNTRNHLDAIYASQRLRLPFEGVLLIGY